MSPATAVYFCCDRPWKTLVSEAPFYEKLGIFPAKWAMPNTKMFKRFDGIYIPIVVESIP